MYVCTSGSQNCASLCVVKQLVKNRIAKAST